jgi:hypothetical protein
MLLRSDLRDWESEDDLVPFVIEAVDRLRLESVRINPRRQGVPAPHAVGAADLQLPQRPVFFAQDRARDSSVPTREFL